MRDPWGGVIHKVLILLCEEYGFHLAQEFYYWNPSKLPNPAEWCTIRRIRVKDAIEPVWWLSKTPWPKASNQRVLQPYSASMTKLLETGCEAKVRPSGHSISTDFAVRHEGSIPPNLLAIPNTESNSAYIRYCSDHSLPVHPARFPATLPEFFIRLCTDENDLVVDPFAGSCVTGEVAERLHRRWICCEQVEEYLAGAKGRFLSPKQTAPAEPVPYTVFRPGFRWDGIPTDRLDPDGGRKRQGKAPSAGT